MVLLKYNVMPFVCYRGSRSRSRSGKVEENVEANEEVVEKTPRGRFSRRGAAAKGVLSHVKQTNYFSSLVSESLFVFKAF